MLNRSREVYLPTIMSSVSDARLRTRRQMSIVKMVLLLLKMDVRELMRALSMTANRMPRAPTHTGITHGCMYVGSS